MFQLNVIFSSKLALLYARTKLAYTQLVQPAPCELISRCFVLSE